MFKNRATKVVGHVQTARDLATGASVLGALGGFTFGKKAAGSEAMSPKGMEHDSKGLVTSSPPVPRPITPPAPPTPNTPRSGWGKWAPVAYGAGAAIIAGAAAGAVYYKRNDVNYGWTWAGDHMKYIKNLWDEKALKTRVENLVTTSEELDVVFRTYVHCFWQFLLLLILLFCRFYTYLPGKPPTHPNPRTFIILPQPNTQYAPYFVQAHNSLGMDEVAAHTGMFQATSNDGYYDLGLQTAKAVREAVDLCRGGNLAQEKISEGS